MAETPKTALEEILKKYPELQGKQVSFGEKIQISPSVNIEIRELPEKIFGPSPKVEIRKSPVHGYGVFAKENIFKDEIIEEGIMLELGLRQMVFHDSVIRDYTFENSDEPPHEYGAKLYLGFGFISLYNHQDNPNAHHKIDFQNKTVRIKAVEDISSESEIFISYGKNYFKFRKIYHSLNEEVKKKIQELDKKRT